MDVLLIVNPSAARGFSAEDVRRTLAEKLAARGLSLHVVETPPEEARSFVEHQITEAVKNGCTRVVAAGGDGTVAMVADALIRSGAAASGVSLAIIPGGTANVLAHELALPDDLEGAATVAAESQRTLKLDAIKLPDRHVFTQIGVGIDAKMIRDTKREDQAKLGRLAYIISLARGLSAHRPSRFTISLDERVLRVRAWQVMIANTGALGAPPWTWGPSINPSDGELDLCLYQVRHPWDYARLLWRSLSGQHRHDVSTKYYRVRKRLSIESDRPLLIQGDGEILGHTPITMEVAPGAFEVLVVPPKTPTEEEAAATDVKTGAPAAADAPKEEKLETVEMSETLAEGQESIQQEVKEMIAERSPTWLLQGPLRHPFTAMSAVDAAIFLHLNNWKLTSIPDRLLTYVSRLMHYGEGWIAVAVVALLIDRPRGIRAIVEGVPTLWLTMLTINYPVKSLFRRRRPFLSFVEARVIGPRPKDFSFPSGHTAAGFAGALIFTAQFPSFAPLFYAIAGVVGFSRVYLGVHYPSDVVIGAIAGTLLAAAYRTLLNLLLTRLWG